MPRKTPAKKREKPRPEIMRDQRISVRTNYDFTREQQDLARKKCEEIACRRGLSSALDRDAEGFITSVLTIQEKTLEEATPEEVRGFILDVQSMGHTVLMAKLGYFWATEWTDEEKEKWMNTALEKAKSARWPVPGLTNGPVWTVKACEGK